LSLDTFERGVLGRAAEYLAQFAADIATRMHSRYSCESYLTYLFAKAFDDHPLICTRETPYADLGVNKCDLRVALDLRVLTPDKTRSLLIEAKQVHDCTIDSYRDRPPEYGDSIAFDIGKLSKIPALPGRTRLAMVLMTSLAPDETSPGWLAWLKRARSLDLVWERISPGDGPLFPMPDGGWFDIYVHKV
jgi:hypothetical protein